MDESTKPPIETEKVKSSSKKTKLRLRDLAPLRYFVFWPHSELSYLQSAIQESETEQESY